MNSEQNLDNTDTQSIKTLIVRHRVSGRVMEVKRLIGVDATNYRNMINGDPKFSEYIVESLFDEYPEGLPGRSRLFNSNGLIVTVPQFPYGAEPDENKHDVNMESGRKPPVPVVECLQKYTAEQCIVAGEFNCSIYSEKFRDVLFKQLDYAKRYTPAGYVDSNGNGEFQFHAQVVCGPVAMIEDRDQGSSSYNQVLIDLVEHEDVDVYYSFRRQPEHFRLAPYALYLEEWHAPMAKERTALSYLYMVDKLVEFQKKKIALLTNKDKVVLCENREQALEKFTFLTKNEMENLYEAVRIDAESQELEEPEKAFDKMDIEELQPFIDKLSID